MLQRRVMKWEIKSLETVKLTWLNACKTPIWMLLQKNKYNVGHTLFAYSWNLFAFENHSIVVDYISNFNRAFQKNQQKSPIPLLFLLYACICEKFDKAYEAYMQFPRISVLLNEYNATHCSPTLGISLPREPSLCSVNYILHFEWTFHRYLHHSHWTSLLNALYLLEYDNECWRSC